MERGRLFHPCSATLFDVLRDGDTFRPRSNSELIQASPKFEFESVKIIHNDVKILKCFAQEMCVRVCVLVVMCHTRTP